MEERPDKAPGRGGLERPHNRLFFEKSPYLLQHAHNPVDWFPWCEEAFSKAREEDKPVFLSVGYSTCHWCHVMERESFEDEDVAQLMNDTFVCIKVDREERPDIDAVYMTICHMLTGSGGWPLTIIMTPDKEPFFAGTYFPKENRLGRAGMTDLIPRVKAIWGERREEVIKSAAAIVEALASVPEESGVLQLGEDEFSTAFEEQAERFDERYGGFGTAPKFPEAQGLLFLLRHWRRTGNERALEMVERTLRVMRYGGVYDHVGFGFHRYSTDEEWFLPHFEKMLYDQALLAMAYTEVYQATGKEVFGRTAEEIFEYVLRDMRAPRGGFFSAEDAESEGVEGRFYVWRLDEVRSVLGRKDADLCAKVFGLEEAGNFQEEASGLRTGGNIFYRKRPIEEDASFLNISKEDLSARLEAMRERLFEARGRRIRPHRDEKVLADWNGLMIAALAKGAGAFGRPEYAEAAMKAADFILENMRDSNGRLLHRFFHGEAAIPAHLDDYAFLIWGLIELYEATFEVRYIKYALNLNDDVLRYFWDTQAGGFYFTADDAEKLLVRQKEAHDGVLPSGNGVSMLNLLRLGRMTTNTELEQKAAEVAKAFSSEVRKLPSAYTQLLISVGFGIGPAFEVVLVGRPLAEDTQAMIRALHGIYAPEKVVLLRPPGEASQEIDGVAQFTQGLSCIGEKATAYVCRDHHCELPTTDVEEMVRLVRGGELGSTG